MVKFNFYKRETVNALLADLTTINQNAIANLQNQLGGSAEVDSDIVAGTPVYTKINGHLDKAQANSFPTSLVVGLARTDTQATHAAQYLDSSVTLTDWTAIAGSPTLTPGTIYFLDPDTPGRLTAIAPSTGGQYVVVVGRAASTTRLEITPSVPILLT